MQSNNSRTTLSVQSSGTPSASTITSAGKQQIVELSGYVIILVENVDGKIKLYGSPSDRDNLEVGDEILEVNGLTLDNISRTEAIRHIHDCIKSCTICLRVRKKNDTRLAWDIGNSVQDAFVIAVEEHARERLQRLAALNRVTPVDITQLSKKLQQGKTGTYPTQKQDLSFLNEASPIYVTSFTSNQITCNSSTVTTATASVITSLITSTDTATNVTTIVTSSKQTTPLSATKSGAGKKTTITKALITSEASLPADRNANTATTAILGATAAAAAAATAAATTKLSTNHCSYQQPHFQPGKLPLQQEQKPQIASRLQHLPVAEEEDDDDEDLVAGAANYCSINFINYNNKNAQITATAPISAVAPSIPTSATVTTTATVVPEIIQPLHHRPPPLQIPSTVLVDAQTSTSPLAATITENISLPGILSKTNTGQQKQMHTGSVDSNTIWLSNAGAKQVDVEYDETIDNIIVHSTTANGTLTPKTEYTTAISSSQLQQAFSGYNKPDKPCNNNNIVVTSATVDFGSVYMQQTETTPNTLSNNNNSNSFIATSTTQKNPQLGIPYAKSGNSILPGSTITSLVTNLISGNSCGGGAGSDSISINSNYSNNCDVLITNNIPPPIGELLASLSEDASYHYDHSDDNINNLLNSHRNQLKNSSPRSSISIGRTELLLGDQSLRPDIRYRRRSGSSIVVIDGDDLKPCLPDDYISSQRYPQYLESAREIDQEMLKMLSANQENGPHREMAVDCPDTFIARNKTPPRYPPPRPVQINGFSKPIPPPRDHLSIEKDGRLINRTPAPQLPDRRNMNNAAAKQLNHIAQIIEPTPEQLDSIKKYQDQLRKRREEEELIAQQNEFLRNSLRGSRKLTALQDSKAMGQQYHSIATERVSGVENEAYSEDEEAGTIASYGDFIAALTRLQTALTKNGMLTLADQVTAVHGILSGAGVAHSLAARHAVLQRRRPVSARSPVTFNAIDLQKDIVEVLAQSNSPAAIELGNLLTTHEMEGLLLAHDRVATLTDPTPTSISGGVSSDIASPVTRTKCTSVGGTSVVLPIVPTPMTKRGAMPLPGNVISTQSAYPKNVGGMALRAESPPLSACFGTLNDQNDNIRIIQIEKSVEPLGATVLNQGEAVVIGRIVRGGAADKSGLLHEGDEILEVNGQELRGKTVHEVCALLSSMQGTLTFLIVPAGSPPPGGGHRETAILHVRAHFDYDPEDDLYIPCRELGISFQKGDVLHVISRDDPKWWQAYREGEEDQTLAGLIPSQMYQHQREAIKLESLAASRDRDGKNNKSATLLCALKGRKKKRKKASSEAGYPLYATTAPDETDPEEILTYEEVALYYPRATHKRPIVLIGPPNIGRHELRQRLMADSERFAAAVPHTSRTRREGEVPGVDYHFITRQSFEADILARRFVEHGEYEKAYYGTSLEAIRTVVASSKICVLNLHPQSLKLLRASDLKPYVVLVAPPSLEKLRQKKIRNGEPFKEEELKDIIATARDMEARWGHLFDMIIINNDTERAYHQLLAEINSLEREPQWVPASWVYNNRDES